MREMGVDEKTYWETLELASRSYIVSLDEIVALDDGDVSLEGILPSDKEDPSAIVENQDDVDRIAKALFQLPEREMQTLSLYYYEGLTLKEIGRILGVSESRVSQIHGKAISALKALVL
jgi:RNA polymerase sigma factor for flagellar operon FliA